MWQLLLCAYLNCPSQLVVISDSVKMSKHSAFISSLPTSNLLPYPHPHPLLHGQSVPPILQGLCSAHPWRKQSTARLAWTSVGKRQINDKSWLEIILFCPSTEGLSYSRSENMPGSIHSCLRARKACSSPICFSHFLVQWGHIIYRTGMVKLFQSEN